LESFAEIVLGCKARTYQANLNAEQLHLKVCEAFKIEITDNTSQSNLKSSSVDEMVQLCSKPNISKNRPALERVIAFLMEENASHVAYLGSFLGSNRQKFVFRP